MGRGVRERRAHGSALRADLRLDPGADDCLAVCRIRCPPPSDAHSRRRAAGNAGRVDRAPCQRCHAQCRLRGRLYCVVWRRRHEWGHHGRQPQSGPPCRCPTDRCRPDRRARTLAAGIDDGHRCNSGHAAGGARNRSRQRRAAQPRHGRGRRTIPGDIADSVPDPDLLFRHRADGGKARRLSRNPDDGATGRSRGRNRTRHRRNRRSMTPHRRFSPAAAIVMTVLLGGACAVGPDFERPAAPDVSGYTSAPLAQQTASSDVAGGEAQRFVQGLDIPGQWWTLFHSAALNTLIEEALNNNPTLPAAEAALRQAWENVYAEQSAFFPTVGLSFSPSYNKTATGALSPASSSGSPYFSLYTGQVAVSYMPDVFGGTRREVESLAATAEFQQFQLEATYLTLTSNVVAAAVQEASLRGQIAATEEIIKIQTDSVDILRKQLALGQVAGADVAAVEATLAQAQATLPPLQKQLAVQRDLLTALIGRLPSQEPTEKFELASLQLPQELPVSLPSKLVEQRPDIQ